jgi:hypothetical protein
MDVEKRHDAKRHVILRQRVVRGDIARGSRDLAMKEWHALRSASTPGGVEFQRYVIGVGLWSRSAAEGFLNSYEAFIHCYNAYWQAGLAGKFRVVRCDQ